MKNVNHENILIVLAGTALALCLASSALMTEPWSGSDRIPFHVQLLESPLYAKFNEVEMTCDITAYCPGSCCNTALITENGKTRSVDWSDRVSSGDFRIHHLIKKGIGIAAVDPAVIPYGSIIEYDGRRFIALDTGSAIQGARIDLLFAEHDETVVFGIRRGELVRVRPPSDSRTALAELRRFIYGGVL